MNEGEELEAPPSEPVGCNSVQEARKSWLPGFCQNQVDKGRVARKWEARHETDSFELKAPVLYVEVRHSKSSEKRA